MIQKAQPGTWLSCGMPEHRGVPGTGGGDIGRCCGDNGGRHRSCTPKPLLNCAGWTQRHQDLDQHWEPQVRDRWASAAAGSTGHIGSCCIPTGLSHPTATESPTVSPSHPCSKTRDLCEHPCSKLPVLGLFSPALAELVLSLNMQLVVQLAAGICGGDRGLLRVMADGGFTPL